MSPLHHHIERLFATADAIEQFLDDTAGHLPYIDWGNLNEAADEWSETLKRSSRISSISPSGFSPRLGRSRKEMSNEPAFPS